MVVQATVRCAQAGEDGPRRGWLELASQRLNDDETHVTENRDVSHVRRQIAGRLYSTVIYRQLVEGRVDWTTLTTLQSTKFSVYIVDCRGDTPQLDVG